MAAAPHQSHRHYLYYSGRYYSALCFLELGALILQVVSVLLVPLELLPMVMGQILQMCSLLLVPIDHL